MLPLERGGGRERVHWVLVIATVVLWALGAGVLACAAVVSVELVAAWAHRAGWRGRSRWSRAHVGVGGVRTAVLMPAHNEEATIGGVLDALVPLLGERDRVLVVADNCTDATATIARAHGAEVIERESERERGKGYALEFGRAHLAVDPPDAVVVLDADCRMTAGTPGMLAREAIELGAPVQAVYLMEAPPGAVTTADVLSVFAVRVKNYLRPLGLAWLGGPCLLVGSGMALPWASFSRARLDGGSVVEDLEMGIDLALEGMPARMCRRAHDVVVRSELPRGRRAAMMQRTRWEHGHLRLIWTRAPRLVLTGVRRRSMALLSLGAEVAVPPLSLLVGGAVGVVIGGAALAGVSVGLGGPDWVVLGPLVAGSAACVMLMASLALHWRGALPENAQLGLGAVAWYMTSKAPIYLRFAVCRQREWVRTPRRGEDGEPPVVAAGVDGGEGRSISGRRRACGR